MSQFPHNGNCPLSLFLSSIYWRSPTTHYAGTLQAHLVPGRSTGPLPWHCPQFHEGYSCCQHQLRCLWKHEAGFGGDIQMKLKPTCLTHVHGSYLSRRTTSSRCVLNVVAGGICLLCSAGHEVEDGSQSGWAHVFLHLAAVESSPGKEHRGELPTC